MKNKQKLNRKTKNGAWFAPVRWSYLPVSWQGWALYVPYIAYLVATFLLVDKSSHSVSDTLIGIVPYWVAGVIIMQWIASHKS